MSLPASRKLCDSDRVTGYFA